MTILGTDIHYILNNWHKGSPSLVVLNKIIIHSEDIEGLKHAALSVKMTFSLNSLV